ncbi:MAG: hypothetical protein E7B11_22700 [Clostridiales bacterium]|nr:hypothetical protein [Clostridiales bacterium]MDU3243372.1 hypothetical protein [Clostridiales bacterium]
MFKIKKAKGLAVGTCAMMLMGALGGTALTVMAASEGVTPVTYDNSTIIDVDGNGKWGVTIPTSLNFTDSQTTITSEVELIGINGTDLDATFSKVEVTGKVKSAGGYALTGPTGSTPARYSMTIDGKTFSDNATEQDFQRTFGMDTAAGTSLSKKLNVSATLTHSGNLRGRYKDTLTFNFVGTATTL